jgi:hypothetical protein
MSETTNREENLMPKYLRLKHYRSGPVPAADHRTPEEAAARARFMHEFAIWLEETGESPDNQTLTPEGEVARYDGEARPSMTDGPFAETKDLIAE